jgi:anti-anti-sigma regulatory factor
VAKKKSDDSLEVSENSDKPIDEIVKEEKKIEAENALDILDMVDVDDKIADTENEKSVSEDILEETDHKIVLEIPQTLDLDASAALFEKIKNALNAKKDIEVKADKVEFISTAAVQVFISTSRFAKENNLSLKWIAPSEVIGNTFSDMGLYGQLMTMEFA